MFPAKPCKVFKKNWYQKWEYSQHAFLDVPPLDVYHHRNGMKVGAFAAATAIFVSALLVVRAAASTVGTLATAAEEGDLTIFF